MSVLAKDGGGERGLACHPSSRSCLANSCSGVRSVKRIELLLRVWVLSCKGRLVATRIAGRGGSSCSFSEGLDRVTRARHQDLWMRSRSCHRVSGGRARGEERLAGGMGRVGR